MNRITQNLFRAVLPAVLLGGVAAQAADSQEPTISVTPEVRYVHVDGDARRFRQDWWINDKLAGGIDELSIQRKFGKDWQMLVEGRAMFNEEDYALRLELVKPDFGFFRAGYQEFRKYFDDSGGYFNFGGVGPAVAPATQISLGRDLHLDIGQLYAEFGLTLPNLPVLVLGYEHRFKEGTKSMIEWGSVTERGAGAQSRKIFPAAKDIDETVHIFKVDLEHSVENVLMANQFRYENYRTDSTRLDDGLFVFNPISADTNRTVTARELYKHDLFSNTFHMESHVNEKLFWSMGYLFLDSNGDAAWDVNTYNGLGQLLLVNGTPPATGRDRDQQTTMVGLDQNSHVLNGNVMVGPFFKKSTVFYGGLQAEKTETDAREAAELFEGTVAPDEANESTTHNDKDWFEERIGVRITAIPFTTLYAEGRWDQGNVALFEEELISGLPNPTNVLENLTRYTDTDITRSDYRVGANTSPARWATLSAYYRYNERKNEYNNLVDVELLELDTDLNGVVDATEAEPQLGYSAFIAQQKLTTDEYSVKLTVRPTTRLSLSARYQYVQTEIDTDFELASASNQTGDYQAHVYTLGFTAVPINRLYLNGLVSFRDSETEGRENGAAAVALAENDVLSFVLGAGYALDNKTDLRADYSFSRADNTQQIPLAAGLNYGSDYTRHGVSVALSRAIRNNVVARLRYGFYNLNDDLAGGFDDYTAHLVSGSCTVRF